VTDAGKDFFTSKMPRATGTYRVTRFDGEEVRAFVPAPLPPRDPALALDGALDAAHTRALGALGRLSLAGELVPSAEWFLYGFVRKEAVVTSQIEGTEATLRDVITFEATREAERPDDVREVCNYVDALLFARREIARARGLPLSTRLLCAAHKRLMRGVRGQEKQPGELRRSQNWIGGTRPGNARFVPPPPELVADGMGALEKWIHSDDPLPPLVRAGVAHVQFETVHPFLDGNGRIGRLLVALLLEHWGLTRSPLLYLSVAIRRRQAEYYARLSAVRTEGNWEGWTAFFLECVRDAAEDGVSTAQRLFALVAKDRREVLGDGRASVASVRLLETLPSHPVVTLALARDLLNTTKPTAAKAIESLIERGVLRETTGRQRDRVYAYQRYVDALTGKD
jgi:Fic family protein